MGGFDQLVRRLEILGAGLCLLVALTCVGQGMSDALFSGQVEGRFVNPTGPDGINVTGVGTSVFGWGKNVSSSSVPNQFSFEVAEIMAEEGMPFVVGVFEYSNGNTAVGSNAESVGLELVVTLADSLPSTFTFPLLIGTTVNSGDSEDSSDSISLGLTTSGQVGQVILAGGDRFVLHLEFGETSEDGFGLGDSFSVFENSVATAEIIGTITRVTAVTGLSLGVFDGAQGGSGMVTTGEGSDTFTWGESATERPNRFRFEGLDFVADTELPFTVGKMHYFNGSISASSTADSVNLFVSLDLPGISQETFEFPLNIITTTNGSNREQSADIVEIGGGYSERRITIDGIEFGLRLMFGSTTEEGFSEVNRFSVFEDGSATADLQAVLTRYLPQAEPNINLEIVTAVQVKFRTFPGSLYQIQSSDNVQDWENEGDSIVGTGRLFSRFYSVPIGGTRIFRVVKDLE